nr:stalk domain-containing protein [Paenibacillus pseudetheri]
MKKTALAIGINGVTGAITVNNNAVKLPTLPFIENGSMYLLLRFISEQLGANVEWLPQEERIAITMQ